MKKIKATNEPSLEFLFARQALYMYSKPLPPLITSEKNWPSQRLRQKAGQKTGQKAGQKAVNNSSPVIAGTCRIANELAKEGHEVINPDELLGKSGKAEILAKTGEIVAHIDGVLENLEFSRTKHNGILGSVASSAFNAIALQKVYEKLGFANVKDQELAKDNSLFSSKSLVSSGETFSLSFVDNSSLFSGSYSFNFHSTSAKKLDQRTGAKTVHIAIVSPDTSPAKIYFRNKLQILKAIWPGARARYRLMPILLSQESDIGFASLAEEIEKVAGPLIGAKLIEQASHYAKNFDVGYHTMSAFLKSVARLPEFAKFNFAGKAKLDGIGQALHENRIPIQFISHGALIAYDSGARDDGVGDGVRENIAGFLSKAIYNEPHFASQLFPRSPLQVSTEENRQKIKAKSRLVSIETALANQRSNDGRFVVYHAHNFVSWHIAGHGMSTTCFEANDCIRKLAGVVGSLEGVEVLLRIKTTAKDKGKKSNKLLSRGLLPQDFNDLYDPAKGIFDASLGSHQAYLNDCDIVVTEGVTAVMFEALEQRKPVLLLNKDKERIASLPSMRVASGQALEKRSAVYSASCEDDLAAILIQLRDLHKNSPLSDEELARYIWV